MQLPSCDASLHPLGSKEWPCEHAQEITQQDEPFLYFLQTSHAHWPVKRDIYVHSHAPWADKCLHEDRRTKNGNK